MGARRQRGVALLTALLVTALVTVIAVAMASEQQIDIRRTSNVMDADRAYTFGLGVESWAKQILARSRSQTVNLTQDWAVTLPPLTVEGATVTGKIFDLQGRFNLNDLVKNGKASPPDVARFQRLLTAVGLTSDLAQAVVDWIDADNDVTFPDGAEDTAYLAMDPPYRAANQYMVSTSELLLVKGFTVNSYNRLAPFVSALPEYTQINVNTAPPEVLMALVGNLDSGEAKTIADEAKDQGFDSLSAFQTRVGGGRQIPADAASVTSRYFLVWSNTRFGRGRMQLYSLLLRQNNGTVKVLTRSQGIY